MLQQIIKEDLEDDRALKFVDVAAPSLEAAVAEAAQLLNIPPFRVEYEVTYRGFAGFVGVGMTDWKIRAYEKLLKKKSRAKSRFQVSGESSEEALSKNKDGDFFIQLRTAGAFLKVVPPVGNGSKASEQLAMLYLNDRGAVNIDTELVKKVVQESAGEYFRVADYQYDLMNNTMASIEMDPSEMKATMTVTRPGKGGCDMTGEEYIDFCKSNKLYSGIKEDFLMAFADKPVYGEKVEVALGKPPVNGKDAYIQFNFETEANKVRLKEGKDGRVDFKELNIIKNVVQNQILATKIPAEKGEAGLTLTSRMLTATDGKDIDMPLGENTTLGEGGDTIVAEINGQVMLLNGLICVEPVYTVEGDVDLGTGNILFLGSVVVKGNVEDGFTVKATGNIVVHGLVSKAELEAEGDITIHQGVNAKGGGMIKAGKNVYAKFLENATVSAGDSVAAEESIVNSQVDALNKIYCNGKKAAIIGGHLRAREEISAKTIGNASSGTETICEVGYDPASKKELVSLFEVKKDLTVELEQVKLEMITLQNIKKQRKSLPPDKETQLQGYLERRQILMEDLKKNSEKIDKLEEYLRELKTSGTVSASVSVFPGAIISIRDVKEAVSNEYKSVTFLLDNDLVRVKPYKESDEG